jgi:hypothetical protein
MNNVEMASIGNIVSVIEKGPYALMLRLPTVNQNA